MNVYMKSMLTAPLALAMVIFTPTGLLAQQSTQDKKDVQVITITRSGETDEKTVVEIEGEKVKVNGKDLDDVKDVKVRVMKRKPGYVASGSGTYIFDSESRDLFNEDPNRAMLGVVTEGNSRGAEVASVSKESAAEKAGIKKGDVITKIGDKKIENPTDLTNAIREHKPGDKVAVSVLRDGKEHKMNAELGKYKGISIMASTMPRIADELKEFRKFNMVAPPEVTIAPSMAWGFAGGPRLGVSIQDTDDGKGVKVVEVDEDGNAAKAGIKKGDVILEVDGTPVSSVDQVMRGLREKRNAAMVKIQLQRDGKTEVVDVKFPRKLKTVDL